MLQKILSRRFSAQVVPKFPEGTVAGLLKASVAAQGNQDVVRFNNQNLNWTLKELDRYSSAFAFGLLEAGFTRGDRILVWVDRTKAAESVVAQLGAYKTGVEVCTFHETTNRDALHHALSSTGVKGVVFSPDTDCGNGETRHSLLQGLMPELAKTSLGEELNLADYPHLQNLIQTGHRGLPGVNRFKDVAVYTSPAMSSHKIPVNNPDDVCMRVIKGGAETTYTSQDFVNYVQ